MNCIVLCEGESDHIVLSEFFCSVYNFKFDKERSINKRKFDLTCNSYVNNKVNLDMLYVGGHDFTIKLNKVLENNKLNTYDFYDHIVVVTDHDSEKELDDIVTDINRIISDNTSWQGSIVCNDWLKIKQNTDFEEEKEISLLILPVPVNETGALETFLLDALSKKKGNSYIVEKSYQLIKKLVEEHGNISKDIFSDSYLHKRRDIVKAPLAVFLGITIPERVFAEQKKMLSDIPWGDYIKIQEDFGKLRVLAE